MMSKQVFFSSSGHSLLLLHIPVFFKKRRNAHARFPKKKVSRPTARHYFFSFRRKGGIVDRRPTGISVENREGKERERERESVTNVSISGGNQKRRGESPFFFSFPYLLLPASPQRTSNFVPSHDLVANLPCKHTFF